MRVNIIVYLVISSGTFEIHHTDKSGIYFLILSSATCSAMSVEFFDQRLASLKTDLKVYGGEIVEYVSSLYSINQPDSRFELKNDAFSMLNVLQIDVAEILKESQQRTDQKSQQDRKSVV